MFGSAQERDEVKGGLIGLPAESLVMRQRVLRRMARQGDRQPAKIEGNSPPPSDGLPMSVRDLTGLVVKVLLGATGISMVIKYLGPLVEIAPTSGTAIAIVLLPPVILTVILSIRALRQPPPA